jgi:hypothetical protein
MRIRKTLCFFLCSESEIHVTMYHHLGISRYYSQRKSVSSSVTNFQSECYYPICRACCVDDDDDGEDMRSLTACRSIAFWFPAVVIGTSIYADFIDSGEIIESNDTNRFIGSIFTLFSVRPIIHSNLWIADNLHYIYCDVWGVCWYPLLTYIAHFILVPLFSSTYFAYIFIKDESGESSRIFLFVSDIRTACDAGSLRIYSNEKPGLS